MFNSAKLREWRELEGISQTSASIAIGITQPYYHELETGKKEPSLSLLNRISNTTGIAASEFIVNNDSNPIKSAGAETPQDSN